MISHFYSDPHMGHLNIIDYAERPFYFIDQMDEALVSNYNEMVGPDDAVLWLGDAFFYPFEKAKKLLAAMNGTKILILGNHDRSRSSMSKLGFSLVLKEAVMHIGGRTVRLSHYPYAGSAGRGKGKDDRYINRRPVRKKGEVLIHGHTHTNRKVYENQIHVGVDAWDYRPVSYKEVESLITKHFPT
jgi:calcineurin-like phosphoesterase family protein